jgi:NRPS condensation-like uncharacterized protein
MTGSDTVVLRPLDPMERYFWMLGQLEAMNIVGLAELDRQLDVDALTEAVRAVQLRHPLLQARVEVVDGEYVFVAAPDPIPLTVTTVEGAEWLAEAEAGFDVPFPEAPAPLARCVYLPFSDGERSVLLVLVHHAMGDGRSVCCVVQQILRYIDEGSGGPLDVVEVSGPPTERFPKEISAPRHRVEVLGAIRQERKGLPDPTVFPFHHREVRSRSMKLDRFEVPADEIEGLRDAARALGTTLHGLLGAAGLESASDLLDQPSERLIYLATTTDLRSRMEPPLPEDGVCVAVGLLPTPYLVSPHGDPQLGSRISEQTRREVARGESHLFYTIMRAGSFAASPEGLAQFAQWVATTPQNVTISNVGVIDDTGDPPWVRLVGVHLGTSSNQVAFLALTTYRGHLTITSQTDRDKLSPELIERFLAGVKARLMDYRPAPALD